MKEKTKFGLCGHDYAAPRAECVEIVHDNMLLSVSGGIEAFNEDEEESPWDGNLNP